MIFVSSSCIKAKTIKEAVEKLYREGFTHIELSGGTEYYDDIEKDLLYLKDKYNIEFLLHNYFPPPVKPFVLNLASLNEEVCQMSFEHVKWAIDLSKKLNIRKYGFHAGFRLDIPLSQIGKKIDKFPLFDESVACNKFYHALQELQTYAGSSFELYVENNVLSKANAETYTPDNPLFLTNSKDYEQMNQQVPFHLLLDVAHLKVSSQVLQLDFEKELLHLHSKSNYIHISDNDGWFDTNNVLEKDSVLYHQLDKLSWESKTITLEVYDGIDALKRSYENVKAIIAQ